MTESDRKAYPLATGLLDYFPDALLEVAHVSYVATQQHHPGAPLHWDRNKSTDEPDALMRHFLERGTRDADGMRHSAKVAWRALAMLQKEIEAERDVHDTVNVRESVNTSPQVSASASNGTVTEIAHTQGYGFILTEQAKLHR